MFDSYRYQPFPRVWGLRVYTQYRFVNLNTRNQNWLKPLLLRFLPYIAYPLPSFLGAMVKIIKGERKLAGSLKIDVSKEAVAKEQAAKGGSVAGASSGDPSP